MMIGMGTKDGPRGGGRRRVSVTWLLLAVLTAVALSIGACALWLPDRAPAVLAQAREITESPVGVQEYAGAENASVTVTLSAQRDLIINTSGTVTGNFAESGVESGRVALAVNGRGVVALNTAVPLYRDLTVGDRGADVKALNAELDRLGFGTDSESDAYARATAAAVAKLMKDAGSGAGTDDGSGNPDGSLHMADVLWIPVQASAVTGWQGVPGAQVTAGSVVGSIPGGITRLVLRSGVASNNDRSFTLLGETTTLPAGATEIDDPAFCAKVSATEAFRQLDPTMVASSGLDASVALIQPVQVLRVPAAAVFGVDRANGTRGCIASEGRVIPVGIVGSELGVSLVQADAGSQPATVDLGGRIAGLSCS